jgi:hypothetical protein
MKSGQTLIIQFLLFFLIGMSVFLSIGHFFKAQRDIFREDVARLSRMLTGSYVASLAIASVNTYKESDMINVSIRLVNRTAGYFTHLFLSSAGLRVSSEPGGGTWQSSMHNLNASIELVGNVSSARPIIFTYRRDKNELEVSQG